MVQVHNLQKLIVEPHPPPRALDFLYISIIIKITNTELHGGLKLEKKFKKQKF